ncbi:MAG: alpha-2-macroglobulin, partial [Anaerolineales bacterium]
GAYYLVADAPGVDPDRWSQRLLISVSEYNLPLKAAAEEAWIWATELATGRPVEGLDLTAYTGSGIKIGTFTTDEDGLARVDVDDPNTNYMLVTSNEPYVLGGSGWEWESGLSSWDFGLESESTHPDYNFRGYVYTDRPIYRQGQEVYYRGILRALEDLGYSLPSGETVEVTINDAGWEGIYTREMTLDEFGTFEGKLELDSGAALGEYNISVVFNEYHFSGSFTVAAYRPPEFEVVVSPADAELAAQQATSAEVAVSYYFGGPVAEAAVEWNVLTTPYAFEPAQFGRYTFSDRDEPWICFWCWWWAPDDPDVILSGSGTTDAEGQISILLPSDVMTGGQRLTIEATAYGNDGQVISGRSDVVVHQGDFYVGLAAQDYVGEAGEELAADVVTVDWEGERLPNQDLEMEAYRREWINTFVEDDFGGGTWEWETEDTLVATGTLSTDDNAEGVASFTPEEGGSYRVVVSGQDGSGRVVRSSIWLWVSGDEYVSWRRENNDRITLISDKTIYQPGDTAEILIPTPFEGEQWVWITVERAGILEQEVVHIEGNSLVYELPIDGDYAPTIFVSAVVVKGPDATEPVATHRVGYVVLTVEVTQQLLDISVTPSTEQAEPGDTVTFDLLVRDYSGSPVEASFSVDLVDKAILSLMPRGEDEIVEAFYAQRGLGVRTASGLVLSMNRLLLQQMEELDVRAMAGGIGGGGGGMDESDGALAPSADFEALGRGQGEEGEASSDELREQFEDTAYWDATVVTGRDGRATVEIELPDNLTTWAFRAVGVTEDTEVGEETIELLATIPLLVRPVTPRFFVVDDRVRLAALVSNNTGGAQEVEVTLQAKGLTLEDEASQTVTIADGGEARVTWWVTAQDVEAAEVIMSAVADDYSDSARPRLTTGPDGTLLVHRYTAPEIVGTGGQLIGEDVRTEVVALPPKYDDRQGELTVQLDPSLAAGMIDGLSYLEHYPYECTEQIVSRFLPNVLTYRALSDLGLADPELESKLAELVAVGLD